MSALLSVHDSGTSTMQDLAVMAVVIVILALYALARHQSSSQEPKVGTGKLVGAKSTSSHFDCLTPNLGVVVVGGGIAGMIAALELARRGVQSALVEAADKLGGNSARASSGIVATGTKAQRRGAGFDRDAV